MAFFIVNKNGGVHNVEDLTDAPKDSRLATNEEIAGWYEGQKLPVPAEFLPQPEKTNESGGGKGPKV